MTLDVVRWTARRLPGVDEDVRRELAESAAAATRGGGRIDRALEVVSLLGFALRSMSRRGTLDDRREMIRQGVRVGALVLALADALRALAATTDGAGAAVALAACATAVAIAAGLRASALTAAVAAAALGTIVTGSPSAWSVAVLAAVAVGHRFDARRCPAGGLVCAIALAGGGLVALLAPATTATAIITVTILAAAGGLLLVGWFDPRYAVAATVVWCTRFVALHTGPTTWLLLLTGLVVGVTISEIAIRQTIALPRR